MSFYAKHRDRILGILGAIIYAELVIIIGLLENPNVF